jgi:hypothetical protein
MEIPGGGAGELRSYSDRFNWNLTFTNARFRLERRFSPRCALSRQTAIRQDVEAAGHRAGFSAMIGMSAVGTKPTWHDVRLESVMLQTGHRLAATTQRAARTTTAPITRTARWRTASYAEVPAGAIDAVRDEADSRSNQTRTMTNARYGGARVAVRRPGAGHCLLGPLSALTRLKLKWLPTYLRDR